MAAPIQNGCAKWPRDMAVSLDGVLFCNFVVASYSIKRNRADRQSKRSGEGGAGRVGKVFQEEGFVGAGERIHNDDAHAAGSAGGRQFSLKR